MDTSRHVQQDADIWDLSAKLTTPQLDMLARLDRRDAELTYEKGAGWWLGNGQVSAKVAVSLVRMLLVRHDYGKIGEFEIWIISTWGKKRLEEQKHG